MEINLATKATKIDAFIQQILQHHSVSGTSLIISLYGDAIYHRGGEIWLGSLTALLAGLGFSDRFVRTAVFRLQKEGWLEGQKIGRRSYYRISDSGLHQFHYAENKIYQQAAAPWNGKWDLLLLDALDSAQRNTLKKQLSHLGFGQINNTLIAAPTREQNHIPALLEELNVAEQVIYFQASYPYPRSEQVLKRCVAESWPLARLIGLYHQFIDLFRPLTLLLKEMPLLHLSSQQCFQINLLLIHFYRRIVIKDPLLPEALLPGRWEGQTARRLTINIYQRLAKKASDYINQQAETSVGELPEPNEAYYLRFGGNNH